LTKPPNFMTNNREKGNAAENLAVEFLEKQGFEILDRNWYSQHHELDIIARKNKVVSIIEVKSLATNTLREPYEQVNNQKQRAIISATNAYIRRNNIIDEIQFDIISITNMQNTPKIEFIQNAFYPRVR
jgi:putative endonuclease